MFAPPRALFLVGLGLGACTSDPPKDTTDAVDDGTTAGGDEGGGSGDGGSEDGGSEDGGSDDGGTEDGGDDGEEDAWRDDPRLASPSELDPDLIALVAPNWGGDLAVDGDALTVVGTATTATTSIDWATATSSGTLAVGESWTATDIPLVAGDNTLTFTATDADGGSDVEVLHVTSTPGVPLASGLALSLTQLPVGSAVEVTATVHTAGDIDTIEVGPTDSTGALTSVWGTLADDNEDGLWAGILAIPADTAAAYSLRAVATAGSATGSTPAVDFGVVAPLPDATVDALDSTMDLVDAAMDDADDDPVSRAEAAAQALLAVDDVESVLLDPTGETLEFVQSGVQHIIYQPLETSMGGSTETHAGAVDGALPAGPPPPVPSMASPARFLEAQTFSRAGTAGPPPPPPVRATEAEEIIAVAPFSDHFTGNYDADGDGTVDRVVPLELAEFLPALVDARERSCPELGTVVRYGSDDPSEADLSAVRDGLSAGILSISTHGMVSRHYGPAGWGSPRGILATRQPPWLRDLSDEDKAHFQAGNLVRVKAHGEWVLAFSGEWIRAERPADFPLQSTVVALTACNSGTTVEPIASFMSAGASLAYGFVGSVSAADGLEADVAFLRGFLEREEGVDRLERVGAVHPAHGGSLVWQADDTVYLGDTKSLQNGSFETVSAPSADPDHWTTISALGTDFDAFVVTEYLSTTAVDGSNLLYMFTYDGDPSYNEIGQDVCPAPGRLMRLSFQWQVRTNEWASCGATGVPNWFNVRIQAPDIDSEVLWHKSWTDVCPLLTDTGEYSQKSTGWQQAEVFFEAPESFEADDERVVFTVGGYNSSIWLGFLDQVELVPVD